MKRWRNGFATGCIALLSLLTLFGCCCRKDQTGPVQIEDDNFKLPRKVAGASDPRVMGMINAFNKAGVVNVITIGQDYLITIPSSAVFYDRSPRPMWRSYALLNDVVRLMKQFRKVAVNVTGYSGVSSAEKREQALTLARARVVADYLWSQGIDSRFIFSEGAGTDKPVTIVPQPGDHSSSARIEITFRDTLV